MIKKGILSLSILLAVSALAGADVPVRQEQFIYSLLAFNGLDYTGTFAGEASQAIYLVADVDNFLAPRKTFVYFWPLTGDWKTDTSVLNEVFEGTLEVQGKKLGKQNLLQIPYTYYNIRGEYELNWKVAQGEEADKVWKHYQALMEEYWNKVSDYQRAQMAHELLLNELSKRIGELRQKGADVSKLLEQLQNLKTPEAPEFSNEYVVPPVPVSKAFILNLPVGEYQIRFLTPEGEVMEGSETRVVVFQKRRSNGIGFELIPGDKWTRPVESKTPNSVLYVNGSTDLYLRPFFQDEFNDLYYEKANRNDAKGNPSLMKWVKIQQVPKAQIEVTKRDGGTTVVLENPFYVEQVKGSSLGYKIVPFDPAQKEKGQEPSLYAFHVPIEREQGLIKVEAKDKNGLPLPGSQRQIRVLVESGLQVIVLVASLLPLVVMVFVLNRRARRYTA